MVHLIILSIWFLNVIFILCEVKNLWEKCSCVLIFRLKILIEIYLACQIDYSRH